MSNKKPDKSFLVKNQKARHNYEIGETLEAGLSLSGSEVKSLREKQGSILEAFFVFKKAELWMQNCHIPEYKNGGYANHAPLRFRKLLLHRDELDRLFSLVKEKGVTLVPMKIYDKSGKIKLLVGVGKGKNKGDKREAVKAKADKRQMKEHLR